MLITSKTLLTFLSPGLNGYGSFIIALIELADLLNQNNIIVGIWVRKVIVWWIVFTLVPPLLCTKLVSAPGDVMVRSRGPPLSNQGSLVWGRTGEVTLNISQRSPHYFLCVRDWVHPSRRELQLAGPAIVGFDWYGWYAAPAKSPSQKNTSSRLFKPQQLDSHFLVKIFCNKDNLWPTIHWTIYTLHMMYAVMYFCRWFDSKHLFFDLTLNQRWLSHRWKLIITQQ